MQAFHVRSNYPLSSIHYQLSTIIYHLSTIIYLYPNIFNMLCAVCCFGINPVHQFSILVMTDDHMLG